MNTFADFVNSPDFAELGIKLDDDTCRYLCKNNPRNQIHFLTLLRHHPEKMVLKLAWEFRNWQSRQPTKPTMRDLVRRVRADNPTVVDKRQMAAMLVVAIKQNPAYLEMAVEYAAAEAVGVGS